MGFAFDVRLASVESYIVARHGSLRDLSLAEIDTLDAWAGIIVTEIEDAWPVDTSTSRDSFTWTLYVGTVGFQIENDVDYVQYIHDAGDPALLIDTLVPDTVRANGPQMVAAMKRAVDATEAELAAQARATPAIRRRQRGP